MPDLSLDVFEYLVWTILPRELSPIPLTRTLASLSLVSRTVSQIAQRALYRLPFLSFDPPDTTPPGRTYDRLVRLTHTLRNRPDLARTVESLEGLGPWSTRCLSEAVPNRRSISHAMLDLVQTVLHAPDSRCSTLSVPFLVESDKDKFLQIVATCPVPSSLTELWFGHGGAYDSRDPWIVNVDEHVRRDWGTARFTLGDFGGISRRPSSALSRIKVFRLFAKLGVEDPLEEDDPLRVDPDVLYENDDDDDDNVFVDQDWFSFKLEEFELDLSKHARLSFNFVDRFVRSSRQSLSRVLLKEHQFAAAGQQRALDQFLEAYGTHLVELRTTTADPHGDNFAVVEAIARSCPKLQTLDIGSPTRRPLVEVLDALASSPGLRNSLKSIVVSKCYSLSLISPLSPSSSSLSLSTRSHGSDSTTTTTTMGERGARRRQTAPVPAPAPSAAVVDELSRTLFGFQHLESIEIVPQHDSVEAGYEQEHNVARYLRELDQTSSSVAIMTTKTTRVISTRVSYARWIVEIKVVSASS